MYVSRFEHATYGQSRVLMAIKTLKLISLEFSRLISLDSFKLQKKNTGIFQMYTRSFTSRLLYATSPNITVQK